MSVGRKPKYDILDLKVKLKEYVETNHNKKIRLSDLEKYTNIPRHIWRDNKEIQILIDSLNKSSSIPLPKNESFQLPTAKEFVEKHYGNKNKLIEDVQVLLEILSDLYDEKSSISKIKELKKTYEDKIDDLQTQLKFKDREICNLSNEIDKMYLESENPKIRREKGLKKNMIELSEDNINALSKDIKDIEKEYEGLF